MGRGEGTRPRIFQGGVDGVCCWKGWRERGAEKKMEGSERRVGREEKERRERRENERGRKREREKGETMVAEREDRGGRGEKEESTGTFTSWRGKLEGWRFH